MLRGPITYRGISRCLSLVAGPTSNASLELTLNMLREVQTIIRPIAARKREEWAAPTCSDRAAESRESATTSWPFETRSGEEQVLKSCMSEMTCAELLSGTDVEWEAWWRSLRPPQVEPDWLSPSTTVPQVCVSLITSFITPLPLRSLFNNILGTGKTHCCADDGVYYFDGNNGFWQGYTGQETVVLDEFGGHCLRPLEFQRLCDKYPYVCNVKGGGVPCRATRVHICSNYLPEQWWGEKTRYNKGAIDRRIHVVHYHDRYGHYYLYEGEDCMERLRRKLYEESRNIVRIE